MAKTSGALFSLDASGKFGKTLVVAKWKGRQYIRQLVTPSNPQTTGQQTARAALSSGGKFNNKVELGSAFELGVTAQTPSGQSWASYFAKLAQSKFAASKTAYENVSNATVKGYFDTGATTLGLSGYTIPGDTPLVIPAGLVLWNAYQAAYTMTPSLAPSAAVSASGANITTFLGTLEV